MKALLICPAAPVSLRVLSEAAPIETIPLLGEGMVEYWLSHLAGAGVKEVSILSHDRTDELAVAIGNGTRWGLKVQLIEEAHELTPAQALAKYESLLDPPPSRDAISVMDHFPPLKTALFASCQQFYHGLLEWMPSAKTADRVGVIEYAPGVWTGLNCRIDPAVEIRPPCWIGKNVFIGRGSVIGPGTILEEGAFVEGSSTIAQSCVGPHTFIGQCSELTDSLALGDTLVNLQSGVTIKVPDKFVLCALTTPKPQDVEGWLGRLVEICCRNKTEAQVLWKHLLINRGS